MFNQKSLDVLQQINAITNSAILEFPVSVFVAETGDIQVYWDISKVDPEEFPSIGLMDSLADFLQLFKLFPEDRSVSIEDNVISVKSGRSASTLITSNLVLMDAFKRDATQFERTEEAPSVAVFDLEVEDMKQIKSASSVFRDLTEVIITSKDGDIEVSLGATNRFGARSNTYSVVKDAETTKEFEIKIPVENFKVLPNSHYEVQVKYNSKRDSYRILMINKSLDGLKLMLSTKA